MSDNPIDQLVHHYQRAIRGRDPLARSANLVTIDEAGLPRTRMITLRQVSEAGIDIYVNRESPKAQQLQENGRYELHIFWPQDFIQFRIRGGYCYRQDEAFRHGWAGKPVYSQIADVLHETVAPQSSVIPSHQVVAEGAAALRQQYGANGALSFPKSVWVLQLLPEMIEIWTGSDDDRLHRRELYELMDGMWQKTLLMP
ncbi:hypothetical protein GCM10023116_17900 [Kistimonas scapharcae]|uniref:Pyridoxamine 5'-phosphate oxidase N-terminal domain-containing protein n=1 Tax=Kistimonas scapharcae TaxID=1036133 RepID=A0ABP8V166_9GAMM